MQLLGEPRWKRRIYSVHWPPKCATCGAVLDSRNTTYRRTSRLWLDDIGETGISARTRGSRVERALPVPIAVTARCRPTLGQDVWLALSTAVFLSVCARALCPREMFQRARINRPTLSLFPHLFGVTRRPSTCWGLCERRVVDICHRSSLYGVRFVVQRDRRRTDAENSHTCRRAGTCGASTRGRHSTRRRMRMLFFFPCETSLCVVSVRFRMHFVLFSPSPSFIPRQLLPGAWSRPRPSACDVTRTLRNVACAWRPRSLRGAFLPALPHVFAAAPRRL
ncbi:hypothetical protein MRX96_029318 [Rhipicephalus microplus]